MRWIAIIAAAILLAGCNDPELPVPEFGCAKTGEPYSCGRGSTCWTCLEYAITCPKPTKLAQGKDKLICKLGDQ